MKKVLLIGADGMLGGELKERLEKKYEVVGTTIQTLDICDKTAVFTKVKDVQPYFIINCAAYTNVDGCEVNYELANRVNRRSRFKHCRSCQTNGESFHSY